MLHPKLLPLVVRQASRRPMRTSLTILGVALAMFLFAAVQTLQEGVARVTRQTADDTMLVVYQENRFCPAASRLPEVYLDRIAQLDGVVSVMPMKIAPTNCRTSLDVITFRGVPSQHWVDTVGGSINLVAGSLSEWLSRMDSAILGQPLADRRGLRVGDQFDAFGVRVYVAGILQSDEPQEQNVAYTHLDFLQRSTGQKTLGVVTQFNVRVADPLLIGPVSAAIDEMFADDQQRTHTSSEKGFIARAAADIIHLVTFMQYLGLGSLAAVLALIGNAIMLNVHDRIRDHAIFQTVGYPGSLVARLVVAEGLMLGLLGGAIGASAAVAVIHWGQFSLSNEGVQIPFTATWATMLVGLAISAGVGVLASLVPAWQASRRQIPECFRAV